MIVVLAKGYNSKPPLNAPLTSLMNGIVVLKYGRFEKVERKTGKSLVTSNKICTFAPANRKCCDAPVAQLVEHLTLNQGVQGSSPCGCTSKKAVFVLFETANGCTRSSVGRAPDS